MQSSSSHVALDYATCRPAQLEPAVASASVAFVPIGPLEFHGPHLPLGVDMLIADGLCRRTALRTGGVVLPPLYVSSGVLPLRHGIDFELETLRAVARTLLEHLVASGFKVIVLFSGHGALDHLHILRTESDDAMRRHPGIRAVTTIWNELTVDVDGDIHDHGAKVETSYMLELWPDTVDLELLEDDPRAEHTGVYGANPRFTASREWGAHLADHVASSLAARVESMRAGQAVDNWADLRALVRRLQSGDLEIVLESATRGPAGLSFQLHNPHGQSKYVTAIRSFKLDGEHLNPTAFTVVNSSGGESGTRRTVGDLGPLSGFYLRRVQSCTLTMAGVEVDPGPHTIEIELELAGVETMWARGNLAVSGRLQGRNRTARD